MSILPHIECSGFICEKYVELKPEKKEKVKTENQVHACGTILCNLVYCEFCSLDTWDSGVSGPDVFQLTLDHEVPVDPKTLTYGGVFSVRKVRASAFPRNILVNELGRHSCPLLYRNAFERGSKIE